MTSVGQFAQYLLKQDPQRNPARLTLFNYLKHVLDPALAFTPAVLGDFYGRVLPYGHWQAEANTLAETVRADLDNFWRIVDLNKNNLEESRAVWGGLRHPDTLQVVRLKLPEDVQALVEMEHAARLKSGARLKVVRTSEQEILALLLDPDGGLEAKVYPALALVWGPRLRPVTPISHLFYGADLELRPGRRQILAGTLVTTHVFQVDEEGAFGLTTRGHSFQKFETFIRAKLPDLQDLFASLKRLERYFIEPQTDAYYQETITRLERANRLLGHPSAANLSEAERALGRGRLSLKNIFPNDRLLTLLVTHLDYGISQRRAGTYHGTPPQ